MIQPRTYLNIILTVIAFALVYLCIKEAAPQATASGPVDCRIVEIRRGYRWDAVKTESSR